MAGSRTLRGEIRYSRPQPQTSPPRCSAISGRGPTPIRQDAYLQFGQELHAYRRVWVHYPSSRRAAGSVRCAALRSATLTFVHIVVGHFRYGPGSRSDCRAGDQGIQSWEGRLAQSCAFGATGALNAPTSFGNPTAPLSQGKSTNALLKLRNPSLNSTRYDPALKAAMETSSSVSAPDCAKRRSPSLISSSSRPS